MVKLYYKMGKHDKMLDAYRQMLGYVDAAAVTRNAGEKKINSLLDFMGAASDLDLLQVRTRVRALTRARGLGHLHSLSATAGSSPPARALAVLCHSNCAADWSACVPKADRSLALPIALLAKSGHSSHTHAPLPTHVHLHLPAPTHCRHSTRPRSRRWSVRRTSGWRSRRT